MEAISSAGGKISIDLSLEELSFLSNAVNETLEALESWEFQSRTGETRERAIEIHAQLHKLLEDASRIG